jgi:hypothetical protein
VCRRGPMANRGSGSTFAPAGGIRHGSASTSSPSPATGSARSRTSTKAWSHGSGLPRSLCGPLIRVPSALHIGHTDAQRQTQDLARRRDTQTQGAAPKEALAIASKRFSATTLHIYRSAPDLGAPNARTECRQTSAAKRDRSAHLRSCCSTENAGSALELSFYAVVVMSGVFAAAPGSARPCSQRRQFARFGPGEHCPATA